MRIDSRLDRSSSVSGSPSGATATTFTAVPGTRPISMIRLRNARSPATSSTMRTAHSRTRGSRFAIERGVVGLPNELADPDAFPIDVAVTEAQRALARGWVTRFDLVDTTALLALVGLAGVEHNSVSRFERREQLQRDGL